MCVKNWCGVVMHYCSPVCAIPWCWWVRGWCATVNRPGGHGKDEEKAMRSMGPPHAYVCGLLIKLLHYQIFLESPCIGLSNRAELPMQGFVYIRVVPFQGGVVWIYKILFSFSLNTC